MTEPMTCTECGATMNHHADKLVYPAAPGDVAAVDRALGGIVEELHRCPRCGAGASRRGRSAS